MNEASEDIGLVTAVNGNKITVEIAKGGGCEHCVMRGMCGTNATNLILHFETDGSYEVGDKVKVCVSSGIRIMSSLIVFGLPLLALFVFFLIARRYTNEPIAVLIGFGGLLLAFLAIRLLDKKIAKRIDFQLGGKYEDMP
jgi:positive regulator of sigma E activity